LRTKSGKVFDERFREEKFLRSLSDAIADNSELVKTTGLGKRYQYLSNRFSVWNNDYVEPIRDMICRTPSQKICELEKYSLCHYDKLSSPLHNSSIKNDQIQNRDLNEENKPPFLSL